MSKVLGGLLVCMFVVLLLLAGSYFTGLFAFLRYRGEYDFGLQSMGGTDYVSKDVVIAGVFDERLWFWSDAGIGSEWLVPNLLVSASFSRFLTKPSRRMEGLIKRRLLVSASEQRQNYIHGGIVIAKQGGERDINSSVDLLAGIYVLGSDVTVELLSKELRYSDIVTLTYDSESSLKGIIWKKI